MWFPFARLRPAKNSRTQSRRNAPLARLAVEALEDRTVPAFLAPVNYAAGSGPQAIVTADFNNDSLLDLAVANTSSNTVSVLRGNGDGSFQPPVSSATGTSPHALAFGDFNADGKLDIATANYGDETHYYYYGQYGYLSILLGNGDGSFQAPTTLDIGSEPVSIAAGDLDADGKLDLAVTSSGYNYFFGYIPLANVLWGNGNGTFSGPTTTWLFNDWYYPHDYRSAALADFNGDGMLDFAAAGTFEYYSEPDYDSIGVISVLFNNGLGNLEGSYDVYLDAAPRSVDAGDVNGDGAADLVTANYGGGVGVLLGDGFGGFGTAQYYDTGGDTAAVVLADFNMDGKIDVAAALPSVGGLTVLLGRGDGTLSPPITSAAGSSPSGLAAGDFNRDGWLDAATANRSGNNVSALINDHAWLPPDSDSPSASINDVTVTEGHTGTVNATFTVSLSAASDTPVTVQYSSANGTATAGNDYQAQSGTLTFAPGETTKTITVSINGDRLGEPNETFFVNLSTADAFIADGQGIGTILDDEPRISINDVAKLEGPTGGQTLFVFTVSLSSIYDVPVTVNFATANGTAKAGQDYQAQSGTLTFAPGETTKTITIVVKGDNKKEASETFFLNLAGAVNAFVLDDQGIGTILDDD